MVLLAAAVLAAVVYDRHRQRVAVFLGDSYTAGAGASQVEKSAPYLLAQHYGWRPVDLARGATGYVSSPPDPGQVWCGLNHCPSYTESIPAAAAANPDFVIVNGGRNETAISGTSQWTQGVRDFYTGLRRSAPHATIIATSPIWDDNPTPPQIEAMRAVVRQAVTAVGGRFIDLGEPLLGRPDLVASDGVHPNDAGNKAIAAAFEAAYSGAG
jgi:lysophospholipase L1-like esterase